MSGSNETQTSQIQPQREHKLFWVMGLIAAGILVNIGGAYIAGIIRVPMYLDSIGTVIAAVLGGYLPGILVGLLTNLLKTVTDDTAVYYAMLNVMIAVCATILAERGFFRKFWKVLVVVVSLALIGGGLGSVLTWYLYGFAAEGVTAGFAQIVYDHTPFTPFVSQITADFLVDLADKAITVAFVMVILRLLPKQMSAHFYVYGWRQAPLDEAQLLAARSTSCRGFSLRTKILILISGAMLLMGLIASAISYQLYRENVIEDHGKLGRGVASLTASVIDADQVETYLAEGDAAEGYAQVEQKLYDVFACSPDVRYLYVYQIQEDGCHVVFDLDTDSDPGSEPGEVIAFDASFEPYLDALLAGEEIEPVISNDSYGWLLTAYVPIRDEGGVTRAYAATDISMEQLSTNTYSFIARMVSLFAGFFIMILALGLWLAEYNIILPINTMSLAASSFAYDEDTSQKQFEQIKSLDIHTGDEIEHLYYSISKMAKNSIQE